MKYPNLFVVLLGVLFSGPLRADLPGVIAKVKPSVVIVGTYKSTNSPRFGLRGTGFIAGNGNMVVTNAHVLQQPGDLDLDSKLVVQMRVGQNELQMRLATLVSVDTVHDLALLRFEGPPGTMLRLRDSDSVQEGQAVAFMGFPIGGGAWIFASDSSGHDLLYRRCCVANSNSPATQRKNDSKSAKRREFHCFPTRRNCLPGQ